jgi:DNA-binding response OmpR family regulator
MAYEEARALILEDTDLGRWALIRALEAVGYHVRAPWTWAEASEWLRRERFRLALLAVSSPGHAVDVMVEARRYRPMHAVLLAEEDVADDVRLACGAEPDILTKPLDLGQVSDIAVACLEPPQEARRA